ncbi:MAG: ATP-grasp domain-containing protein [Candidatus Melainabacteria bacterium]|nr:ATP-grasp domain-containing protein [Candidatus Melainabacteria bacterium]
MKRVGILGGGQLGMLLAESIFALGARVNVYDPDPEAPACQHTKHVINHNWLDYDALSDFFQISDVITYEFENVESAALITLEHVKPIYPSVNVLRTCQDRVAEKQFLYSAGLPHAYFLVADSVTELQKHAEKLDYPCIIKTARGGYDGKGQWLAKTREEFLKIVKDPSNKSFDTFSVVVEEMVDLDAEVSCIVARPLSGMPIAFPIFENIHKDHILDVTVLPARIPQSVQDKIKSIAIQAAVKLDVVGLLTTEFFLSKSKSKNSFGIECDGWFIYINEFAPRPHNSGHITRSATSVSQYDALARILLGIPLQEPRPVSDGTYCMMNLLGDVWIDQGHDQYDSDLDLSCLNQHPQVIDVVLYGKREPRRKRKMGHFITHGSTPESAIEAAEAFKTALCRKPHLASNKTKSSKRTNSLN